MFQQTRGVFSKFTNKYSLSKTLRFELKPIFETKDQLKKFIDLDEIRAKEYKELKKIIDEFHKDYIKNVLSSNTILDNKDLESFFELWKSKDSKENKKKIKNLQKNLRKQIVEHFKILNPLLENFFKTENQERLRGFLKSFDKKLYKEFMEKEDKAILNKYLKKPIKRSIEKSPLFLKEFIHYILPEWLENSRLEEKERKLEIIKNFDKFTTYLTGFYKNRKNIYSDTEQGTAIAFRIVNENLPKFFSNLQAYEKIKINHKKLKDQIENIKELKEELDYFNVKQIKNLFKPEFFNQCLSQKGIDYYNTLLGGKTFENKVKIQGINEYINLYRQDQKSQNKDRDIITKYSSRNLPIMELLYKQILSDRESHSFVLDNFENKQELLNAIQEFSSLILAGENSEKQSILEKVHQLFTEDLLKSERDLGLIYIKGSQISAISHSLFGDWSLIPEALRDYFEKNSSQKDKGKSKNKKLKKDFYTFEEVYKALDGYWCQIDDKFLKKEKRDLPQQNLLVLYFRHLFFHGDNRIFQKDSNKKSDLAKQRGKYLQDSKIKNQKDSESQNSKGEGSREGGDIFWKLSEDKIAGKDHLLKFFRQSQLEFQKIYNSSEKKQEFDDKEIEITQNYLNKFMDLFHLVNQVYLEKDRKKVMNLEKDSDFYNKLENYRNSLFPIISLYNKTRNFILSSKRVKKKIKINFEDSTLLDGWDINKEIKNLSVLFRKKENNCWKYYLGIMNKNSSETANRLFDYHIQEGESEQKKKVKKELKNKVFYNSSGEDFYEKMNYKLLPDPSKMLPKVFFSTKHISFFKPSQKIKMIKDQKSYAKNDGQDFSIEDCHKLINFYKESLKKYQEWSKVFKFEFSPTSQYRDISDFFNEVKNQGYNLSFDKIKSNYIEEKVKKAELLLFEIYNKDFSAKSKNRDKSKDNLHTIYFKGLFEEENLKDIILKLNGQAEVFYRKASSKAKRITHPRNQPIQNKKGNPKKESAFKYDLIKDKRFFEDKFFFHFPISLNFKQKKIKPFSFNQEVLRFLKDNKDINIIGIDRGERHLAYYTVIDQNRKILKQDSFNKMKYNYENSSGQKIEVEKNYHELLDSREKERDKNRKEWKKIENIKELKSGYLSYLVHKISQLMIQYNAIVVFEDLNSGFKRGRFKFEKQVYQKLEKALIDKLNYLVFKDKKALDIGGYLKAYQLTAPFESFKKMGKQTGFLFYIPAYYTSKVCPLTGFMNLIYPKYKNVNQSQKFFSQFEGIYFDKQKDYFVFEYQDSKFNSRKESKNLWKVCTYGKNRYKWHNKTRKFISVNLTQKLKNLFEKYKIDYNQSDNLKPFIISQKEKDFFFKLIDLFKLALQLRYTNPDTTDENDRDFILSPIADEGGKFFDSRKATESDPKNADANGAYHIALKGLMSLKNIKNKKDKLEIQSITNKDWFCFLRDKAFSINKKKAG